MYKSRIVAVAALCAAFVLVVACTAEETKAPSQPESPSVSYLAQPVEKGWTRAVGKADGLVLVFEAATVAAPGDDLPYRFVLFNESGAARSWDDALFVVRQERVDGRLGFGTTGDWPVSDLGNHFNPPALSLASGESTTHVGSLSGRTLPKYGAYSSKLVGLFKTGRGRASELVRTPEIVAEFQ